MIVKLINAGYLRPEQQHDADAIATAIARMKQDLRTGRGAHAKQRRDEARATSANVG